MYLRSVHDIASTVRGRRLDRGLSQAEVAAAAGVSRKWVSEFERGKPGAELSAVLSVLAALDIDLEVNTPGRSGGHDANSTPALDLDQHLADYARGLTHLPPSRRRRPTR